MAKSPKPQRRHQTRVVNLRKAALGAIEAGLSVDLIEIDAEGKILLHTSKAVSTAEAATAG